MITGQDPKAFYDERFAGSYMEAVDPVEAHRVSELLRAAVGAPETVLDYGCGRGAWMPVLERLVPGAEFPGRTSPQWLSAGRADAFPSADFRVMVPGWAPFEAESFAFVFSYHVLEHVTDLGATVADMARLVRPGGRLFAALPCGNAGSFEHRLAASLKDGLADTPDGWRFAFEARSHLRRLTTEDVVASFADSGLMLEWAAFGNHLWGALEWICRGGEVYVERLLNPSGGRTRVARCKLAAGRAALRLVADDFARPRRLGFANAVERLAAREWQVRRADPAGSAQYLMFRLPSGGWR